MKDHREDNQVFNKKQKTPKKTHHTTTKQHTKPKNTQHKTTQLNNQKSVIIWLDVHVW